MSFKRVKWIKGNPYLYEVESYRDPSGKVRQRSRYLGRYLDLGKVNERQDAIDFGDRVSTRIFINGKLRRVEGIVVPGFSQVPACRWPRSDDDELLTLPYQPPGTVTVAWRWKDLEGVVQLPKSKTRRLGKAANPSPSLPRLPDWLEAHLQWQKERHGGDHV